MKSHAAIARLLYGYLKDELNPDQREFVKGHLAECERCTTEVRMLREMLGLLPPASSRPSGERAREFWDRFAERVEGKLKPEKQRRRAETLTNWIPVYAPIWHRARYLAVFSGVATTLILLIALWNLDVLPVKTSTAGKTLQPVSAEQEVAGELRDYFRRSKTLFVGLSNMSISGDQPIDLTAERLAARELVRSARSLSGRTLDDRAAKLVMDVEKILIELANVETSYDFGEVEIIRGGINQENLLFKIRMAEKVYTVATHYTQQDPVLRRNIP